MKCNLSFSDISTSLPVFQTQVYSYLRLSACHKVLFLGVITNLNKSCFIDGCLRLFISPFLEIANFSTKYFILSKVHTDMGGIK